MKGSLTVVGFFVLGCLLGYAHWLPQAWVEQEWTAWILYALMFQVGLSIGSDKKLKEILRSIKPKLLLIPLATIVGTLSFSALAALLLTKWNLWNCLAVGSGFAYYSLSSLLITKILTPVAGPLVAAELGTLALMTNVIREIMALLLAPLFVKYMGKVAPICAGGVTSMDTTLPVISQYAGKDMVFLAIFHGVLLDLSVPFFVSLFCSL